MAFIFKNRRQQIDNAECNNSTDKGNKKLIAFALVVCIVIFLCIFKTYFLDGELQISPRFDERFYGEETGYYNVVIIVANDSNIKEKVRIKGYVDKRELFNDYVGDVAAYKPYLQFYGDLAEGEHTFIAETKDCKQFKKVIEISKKVKYVYITYDEDEFEKPRITIEDSYGMMISLQKENLLNRTINALEYVIPRNLLIRILA